MVGSRTCIGRENGTSVFSSLKFRWGFSLNFCWCAPNIWALFFSSTHPNTLKRGYWNMENHSPSTVYMSLIWVCNFFINCCDLIWKSRSFCMRRWRRQSASSHRTNAHGFSHVTSHCKPTICGAKRQSIFSILVKNKY